VPFDNPDTLIGDDDPDAVPVVVPHVPEATLGDDATVVYSTAYPVIAEPPVDAEPVKLTLTVWDALRDALTPVGAPGVVYGVADAGVAGPHEPAPTLLRART
jgi:hypothetical protein